jgi:hypothetical protein
MTLVQPEYLNVAVFYHPSATYPDNACYIDDDIISPITTSQGIFGNGVTDRVAGVGSCKFTLRNDVGCSGGVVGYYTPGKVNSLLGFDVGANILLYLKDQYASTPWYVGFWGHITEITPGNGYLETVDVTVEDWMGYSSIQPITELSIGTNKRIWEVVYDICNAMTVIPTESTYFVGVDTFPTTFDSTLKSTTALSEFAKVALSELGYVYLRKMAKPWGHTDIQDAGETVTVEGRDHRATLPAVTQVPMVSEDAYWTTFAGNHLITKAGNNLVFKHTPLIDAEFKDTMTSLSISYGSNLINRVMLKCYPRRVDVAATTVLFSLNSPISMLSGEIKTDYQGTFRDPAGAATRITGQSMVAPVVTTDYQMWTNSDGTGVDKSADLEVIAVYNASGVTYTHLHNTGASNAFITKLQARGKGVYMYDPVEYMVEDTASQLEFGLIPLTIDMKYQYNPETIATLANVLLEQHRRTEVVLNSITFSPNVSVENMHMFLSLDIGDLIFVSDSKSGINGYYFINSKTAAIGQAGQARCTYGLGSSKSMYSTFWLLEDATLGILDSTTILGY